MCAQASYNLALLQTRELQPALARQSFFRVIDEAPGHELALRSYLRIARSCLEAENGRSDRSSAACTQALGAGVAVPADRDAVAGDGSLARKAIPHALARSLTENASSCRRIPTRRFAAAFLDAFAQYRLLPASPAATRREASDLLSTLGPELDNALLGSVGLGLGARAYVELGFSDQAERHLRQGLTKVKGPASPALEFLLAETLLNQDRRDDALPLFEKLATTPSQYRAKAAFQLARFDLLDKNYESCIERCQQLWADGAITESANLLHLWGTALEATGEFAKAAQCFAGKAPE